MSARFLHGSSFMKDHIPGADVAAGDMILIGTQVYVAHLDIKAGVLGHLARPSGTGVYEVDLLAADAFSEGDPVLVTPATGLTGGPDHFGFCEKAADQATGDVTVQVVLKSA